MTKTILILPGSAREGSFNRKLAHAIGLRLQRHDGVHADVIDPNEFEMPIYNGDLEDGMGVPKPALALAERFTQADAVILVTPEYNASLPPLMKNTLDWLSRDVAPHRPYKGRPFALASCSPGGLGGIRALSHLRDVLVNVGAEMITPQVAVGGAMDAFDESGQLVAKRSSALLDGMIETLMERIEG